MDNIDYTHFIVPAELDNSDASMKMGNESFITKDLVFLDSKKDLKDIGNEEKVASCTDYAIVNSATQYKNGITKAGKKGTSCYWLRSAHSENEADRVNVDGSDTSFKNYRFVDETYLGIRPAMHLDIRKIAYAQKRLTGFGKITPVKDNKGNVIYYTIEFGEYPKTKAKNSNQLEDLFEEHRLYATGKKYLGRSKNDNSDFVENKEFEYRGKKYVRVQTFSHEAGNWYADGSKISDIGCTWIKVEPITWIIRNWDELPKSINPNGNGKATYIDVVAEEIIMGGIPFYPYQNGENISLWQNSTIRGYLNGIDVRNIKKNGNITHTAPDGGNFSKHSFLSEAFRPDLERKLMQEDDDNFEMVV